MALFENRLDAGRKLAQNLLKYQGIENTLVLGLPRGGVPVAYEVARVLHAPLDLIVVRKLGVPGYEELAMGAVASGEIRVLNQDVILKLDIPPRIAADVINRAEKEVHRLEQSLRGDRPRPEIHGKTVILVDDGLATGSTMQAAVAGLRTKDPARVVVAVPAAPPEVLDQFQSEVDEVICLATPEPFGSVGRWYEDFSQTSDEEVHTLLEHARQLVQGN